MAITSQIGTRLAFGQASITEWRKAGLLQPGIIKPIVTTVEKNLVLKRLGRLHAMGEKALRRALESIIG